jgi:hypothetical protein
VIDVQARRAHCEASPLLLTIVVGATDVLAKPGSLYSMSGLSEVHLTQRGNSGRIIQRCFDRNERLASLADFYKTHGDKYPDTARDFFK